MLRYLTPLSMVALLGVFFFTDENEVVKLLNIFTGRLQFVTLNLVKLSSQQANQKKSVK